MCFIRALRDALTNKAVLIRNYFKKYFKYSRNIPVQVAELISYRLYDLYSNSVRILYVRFNDNRGY